MTVDDLLRLPDGQLGASVVSSLSWGPTAENFAALGRIVRAASRADLEAMLRRGGRQPKPAPAMPLFDSAPLAGPGSNQVHPRQP